MASPQNNTRHLRMTMDGIMVSHSRISRPPLALAPMDVRCQCGAVRFRAPTPQPLAVFHCHCRECRRQSSSAYGTSAVFPVSGLFPLDPELRSKLSVYIRPGARSRTGRDMACFFCSGCGARVMHRYMKRRPGAAGAPGESQVRAGPDDGTACGGGGDLGGVDEEEKTTATTPDSSTTDPLGIDDEASYDGTTLTIKGGLITGLDYSTAVHIYTEQAVVPIPDGFKQYPGTPPESP